MANAARERAAGADNLALIYGEVFTAIERVRADPRIVSSAAEFRAQMKAMVDHAGAQAQAQGHSEGEINHARFATVAFLDESVLNSGSPVFHEWPRKPLGSEFLLGHNAGEIFFENLDRLLSQDDTAVLADVLEVYQLCLLLGFQGGLKVGGAAGLANYRRLVAAKIQRIRGPQADLSPEWEPDQVARAAVNPWNGPLMWTAAASLVMSVALFSLYTVLLNGSVARIAGVAGQG